MVAVGDDGYVRAWDTANGNPVGEWAHGQRGLKSVAFSRDGQHFVTSGWEEATVWDTADPSRVVKLLGHVGEVTLARFSKDGKRW